MSGVPLYRILDYAMDVECTKELETVEGVEDVEVGDALYVVRCDFAGDVSGFINRAELLFRYVCPKCGQDGQVPIDLDDPDDDDYWGHPF